MLPQVWLRPPLVWNLRAGLRVPVEQVINPAWPSLASYQRPTERPRPPDLEPAESLGEIEVHRYVPRHHCDSHLRHIAVRRRSHDHYTRDQPVQTIDSV